ncbi:MAG: nucleotidyl transferase AbiEii/AbiGii toxin family protein [bacterium]|nr:nucleotidyl transferase AbiEii/AbiGii toxin family protein [bacterium]
MIPRAHVTAWRQVAPWALDEYVEQDLALSRALVEIYSDPLLQRELAFRGGTALHKLFLDSPLRYSEDIDLIQATAGPIGDVMSALRARLEPWLGPARWKQNRGRVTLYFRYQSEIPPIVPMRLKIEINTREHFAATELGRRQFEVTNPWFTGTAEVTTFLPEELLGSKLRALYQRKKGRDLFDMYIALDRLSDADPAKIVDCFLRAVEGDGGRISRAQFEANLAAKREDRAFLEEVRPLLAQNSEFDPHRALDRVLGELIRLLPGEPWAPERSD